LAVKLVEAESEELAEVHARRTADRVRMALV
jgi:hypothetical protein